MNFKIGDRIFVRGYIDEIRKDTVIVRNDGGYFGTILSEVTGELSSAQPERKTGRWIYGEDNPGTGRDGWFCSECEHFEMWDYSADMKSAELNLPNFCPNCGARMI